MTDQEILEMALGHATCFTSCIQFSDQDLIAFARELLDHAAPAELKQVWKLYEAHRRSV